MPTPTRPDLVLFDCDGVLVDSEKLTTRVFRDDLAAHGLDLHLDDIHSLFVGGTIAGMMHKARQMGADLPDDWLPYIHERMYTVLDAECRIIDGVDRVLDLLDAAGIGYAVGSNGPMAKMHITLKRTGLYARLQGRLFSAHDCPAAKPAPDVYLKAASHAGVVPGRCVVIEDSASGAQAGRAAQMRVLGYAADTPRDRLVPHCHAIFDDMAALPDLLGL